MSRPGHTRPRHGPSPQCLFSQFMPIKCRPRPGPRYLVECLCPKFGPCIVLVRVWQEAGGWRWEVGPKNGGRWEVGLNNWWKMRGGKWTLNNYGRRTRFALQTGGR